MKARPAPQPDAPLILTDEDNSTSALTGSIEAATAFIQRLAGDSPVTFQTFRDRKDGGSVGEDGKDELAAWYSGSLSWRAPHLRRLNNRGAGIFVMVNEGDGKGRKAKNVTRIRALFVDLDGAPLNLVRTAPLQPHMIVESSPDRFHCYWLVEGVELKAFRPAQRFLAERYGGDEAVCDLPRVMRLPGFLHRKGKPFMVNLKEITAGDPYTPEQLEKAWPGIFAAQADNPAPVPHTTSDSLVSSSGTRAGIPRNGISRRALAALEGERAAVLTAPRPSQRHPKGQRNNTLNKAAFNLGQLVGAGELAREVAEDELLEAAMQNGLGREEAMRTIESGITAGMEKPRPDRNGTPPKAQAEPKTKGSATAEAGTSKQGTEPEVQNEAGAIEEPNPPRGRPPDSTRLIKLARENIRELFHDPESNAYAAFSSNSHLETWPIRGQQFKLWLRRLHHTHMGKAAKSETIEEAVGTLESLALFDGKEQEVHLRTAEHEGRFYLDLADDAWRVVEIDTDGWRVLERSPVKFRRRKGMNPLPIPVKGGSITDLRQFVNVTDDDWPLLLGFLAMCVNPRGPYPILVLIGGEGRGKSTQARILRDLIDPSKADLRARPDNAQTLMLAAHNSHVVAFDNLSDIPNWLSDDLSRLSTGAAFTTRKLYTTDEEDIMRARRPIIITGIDELASRPDLLSRCILLEVPEIQKRVLEDELWPAFAAKQPAILGALLSTVSAGMKALPSTTLDELPRMADFARWATACESSLGLDRGEFIEAYALNRKDANELALANSPLTEELISLATTSGGSWQGTSTDLLEALLRQLENRGDTKTEKLRSWPKDATRLSKTLRRLETSLKRGGLKVEFVREAGGKRTRWIALTLETSQGL